MIDNNIKPEQKPTPSYLWSVLSMKCPRCRRGAMFCKRNPYTSLSLKNIFAMHDKCAVCSQKFDLEKGFWYGTGYVSYALTVAFSVATFVAWWVLIGFSFKNNTSLYWLITNAVLLVLLQPWLMRLSRSVYIYFFINYNPDYEHTPPQKFDA